MALNVCVVYGSVREARQGIKAAKFIVKKIKERGHNVDFIDPLKYDLPLLKKTYADYDEGQAPEVLKKLSNIFVKSDAVVVVSGEYNHGIPPALKNLLDHFYLEYHFKPSGIVSYSSGSFGGVSAAFSLRPVLCEMGMSSIPTVFMVSKVQDSFDEEGNAVDTAYERRVVRFLDELEWYGNALKKAREKGVPY